jgi:nucleotide-binding universal stress UspA family protein
VAQATDVDGHLPLRPTLDGTGAAASLVAAGERNDLVVVGSRGLGTLRAHLLGSVSRQVVEHCPCSVLVVRTSGER